jgi:ATP-dependent Clp protease ATP-binding subunit ClpA
MPQNFTSIIIIVVLVAGGVYYYLKKKKDDVGGGASGGVLITYTRDLTEAARQEKIDPVIGRQHEIDRVVEILSRKSKNNPLLIGPPGVGKTAIAEGLALKIVNKQVPDALAEKRVMSLDLPSMIAGTKYRGEFEKRIKGLLEEITASRTEIILFIDEVHMLAQAKGAEGAINVSDIIKPALARGELHVIGATTQKEYETSIQPDETLDRRFQPVMVNEPSHEETLEVLRGIRSIYEKFHGVRYTDEALTAAIDLSAQFAKKRYLPDRAIDLMDEAGAHVKIRAAHEARHTKPGKGADVKAATLAHRRSLERELAHMKSLKEELGGESEAADLERNMQHLADKISSTESLPVSEGAPEVTAADIKSVIS